MVEACHGLLADLRSLPERDERMERHLEAVCRAFEERLAVHET
jgi:hypothetical protein